MKTKREIKPPTSGMLDYYSKLFKRNQSKWIRRSKLEPDHLGSEFMLGDQKAVLVGSMNSEEVVISTMDENKFFVAHIDDVTKEILGKIEDHG